MRKSRVRLPKSQSDNLRFITKHIKYGDVKEICKSTNYSRSTVYRHLSGTPYNEDTVSEALRIIRLRMRKTHKQAAVVATLK